MLPQVLVRLGLQLLSDGCLLWLQRLQPLFFVLAMGALVHQAWLSAPAPGANGELEGTDGSRGRPALNVIMIAGWIAISVLYR